MERDYDTLSSNIHSNRKSYETRPKFHAQQPVLAGQTIDDSLISDRDEIDFSIEQKSNVKTIAMTSIFFHEDITKGKFSLKMTQKTDSYTKLRRRSNSKGVFEEKDSLDDKTIISPYRSKQVYDQVIYASNCIENEDIKSTYKGRANMKECLSKTRPNFMRNVFYDTQYFPETSIVIHRKRMPKQIIPDSNTNLSLNIIRLSLVDQMSQCQVAERLGCSQSTVSRALRHFYETGDAYSKKKEILIKSF